MPDIPETDARTRPTGSDTPGVNDMKRVTMSHSNALRDEALNDTPRWEAERIVETDAEAGTLLTLHLQHVEELHKLYDPILSEPVPDRMLRLLRRYRED